MKRIRVIGTYHVPVTEEEVDKIEDRCKYLQWDFSNPYIVTEGNRQFNEDNRKMFDGALTSSLHKTFWSQGHIGLDDTLTDKSIIKESPLLRYFELLSEVLNVNVLHMFTNMMTETDTVVTNLLKLITSVKDRDSFVAEIEAVNASVGIRFDNEISTMIPKERLAEVIAKSIDIQEHMEIYLRDLIDREQQWQLPEHDEMIFVVGENHRAYLEKYYRERGYEIL